MEKRCFRQHWKRNVRQHKTKGHEKARRRNYYIKNRAKRREYSRIWRRKNRHNTVFKRSESRRRKTRRTRINASEEYFLTGPETVEFVIGPEYEYGYVTSISKEELMVYTMIESPDYTGEDSFPVELFMKMAIFLDERDLEDFYAVVDREIGEDAYGDLDKDMVEECAGRYNIDPDSEAFRGYFYKLTGKLSLDDMNEDELEEIVDSIMEDHREEPMGTEKTSTGEIMMFDQWNPSNREISQPGEDVGYSYTSPIHYMSSPDEKKGVPPGHGLPWMGEDSPPATSRVIPYDMVQNLVDNYSKYSSGIRTAATIPEILANCGAEIVKGSKKVQYDRTRILPEKGMITYTVKGSKGETYKVWLKAIRKGNVKAIAKMQVQVSCSCNFFRWSGPEHWAKQNSYLYGKPFGTASRPNVRDPSGKHWVCKHLYAILSEQSKLRFASSMVEIVVEPMDVEDALEFMEIEYVSGDVPNPARVAGRFLRSSQRG